MASTRVHLVLVHGLFSSAKVWRAFETLIADDPELAGLVSVHPFEYDSPLGRLRPDRRVAETDDIADQLGTFLETELADAERIVLVTHSQGVFRGRTGLVRATAHLGLTTPPGPSAHRSHRPRHF
ncbi:esterase/lipase family protein [Streptomyces misionensis]|uniref:esterase/lipase family protein n=1 Tax=Streptomyces misionensis TaxID=67331 RepID=UPI0038309496